MTGIVDTLKSRLSIAQRRLTEIDLESLRAGVVMAQEAAALAKSTARARLDDPVSQQTAESTAVALRQAERVLEEAAQRHLQLRAEVDRLSGMLFADERIAQAEAAVRTVDELVASATSAVDVAQATVSTIVTMITDETRIFEAARDAAAADLLATVKAGGDASRVHTPTLDKVATLELAKGEAEQELAAAQAALQAAQQRRREALQHVHVARAGKAELDFQVAAAAYIEALGQHAAAYWRVNRAQCPRSDATEKGLARAAQLLAADGTA